MKFSLLCSGDWCERSESRKLRSASCHPLKRSGLKPGIEEKGGECVKIALHCSEENLLRKVTFCSAGTRKVLLRGLEQALQKFSLGKYQLIASNVSNFNINRLVVSQTNEQI